MISSLVCSVYILYLYRKLNTAEAAGAMKGGTAAAAIQAEIAALNAKINTLETLSSGDWTKVTAP
jgi:hypothetical protein